jgi:hypothetical protein
VALLVILWAGSLAHQEYWIRGARRAVTLAVSEIAAGGDPPNVHFAEFVDRQAMSSAFAGGFEILAFDNIPFGFRDYEVKIRVANGDFYNFDAFHRQGAWQLDCCAHWDATEVP